MSKSIVAAPFHPTRRALLGGLAVAAAAPGLTARAEGRPTDAEIDGAIRDLLRFNEGDRAAALEVLARYDDPDLAPSLILVRRFAPGAFGHVEAELRRVTGEENTSGWFEWMLWQERHPEIRPHPTYADLKRDLFLSIDPNFEIFLRDEYLDPDRMRIRFEEITWGGVRKDGIPSLDNPELIPAADAGYLRDDDLVFGVAINGDIRAYPLRIMGWHEMFNEVIGGVPVALAYCTLCGSGILFETAVEGRDAPFVFGSSGFLYRSNKLMFDRETHSLWNQFTGRPVSGPLVDSGIELRQRPVVITTWARWRAQNLDTQVLSLETGHIRDYRSGVVYREYFASPDLMFPTLVDQRRLQQKDYVFGVRTVGAAKAWPLEAFGAGRVINDSVGPLNLVLIGDVDGRTVRAYDRGARTFSGTSLEDVHIDGVAWTATEEGLRGPNGELAPRVAGHIAYWFAWDGYLGAESEFFDG